VFHDPCYLDGIAACMTSRGKLRRWPESLLKRRARASGAFAAVQAEAWRFLAKRRRAVSQVRAAELAATGADIVAAACPFCNTMFRDALAAQGEARQSCWTLRRLRRGDCRMTLMTRRSAQE